MCSAPPYPRTGPTQGPNVLCRDGRVLASLGGNPGVTDPHPACRGGPMRLSGWRARAPSQDSVMPKVLAVVEGALTALGAESDPECWIAWGDDPAARYLVLAPTPAGPIQTNGRVNAPGGGQN